MTRLEFVVVVTRACAAGSLATTRPGAQTSLPTRSGVDERLSARAQEVIGAP
jgi:sugar/nucleoside kinase (ribokinase family)